MARKLVECREVDNRGGHFYLYIFERRKIRTLDWKLAFTKLALKTCWKWRQEEAELNGQQDKHRLLQLVLTSMRCDQVYAKLDNRRINKSWMIRAFFLSPYCKITLFDLINSLIHRRREYTSPKWKNKGIVISPFWPCHEANKGAVFSSKYLKSKNVNACFALLPQIFQWGPTRLNHEESRKYSSSYIDFSRVCHPKKRVQHPSNGNLEDFLSAAPRRPPPKNHLPYLVPSMFIFEKLVKFREKWEILHLQKHRDPVEFVSSLFEKGVEVKRVFIKASNFYEARF